MRMKQLAYAISLISVATIGAVHAEDQPAKSEKIEVTGTSIKRIAKEGALPVQTFTKEAIAKSGATSVTELIQNLPSMQGFQAPSQSVNSGGGGVTTASLHSLGSKYTLVLLNGHRMAPADTGSTVNLESIPLAAIERVEVLTDGASALYGADAIGGVVNFILKKNYQGAEVHANYDSPQKSGGSNSSVSVTGGFGSLDQEGFNVQLSYSHDDQKKLTAAQRSATNRGGVFKFKDSTGRDLWYTQWSSNAVPANLLLTFNNDPDNQQDFVSPYRVLNGDTCPVQPQTITASGRCRFNYAATVDNVPASKRDSFFASGRFKLGDNFQGFADVAYSDYKMTAAFAPPAQPIGVIIGTPGAPASKWAFLANDPAFQAAAKWMWDNDVGDGSPYDPTKLTDAQVWTRVYDAGRRTDIFQTKSLHTVVGVDGSIGNWDVSASFTHSDNKTSDTAVAGYVDSDKFLAIIKSGAYNPMTSVAGSAVAALAPAVLHQVLDQAKSGIDALNVHGSRAVFDLPDGEAMFGGGLDLLKQSYKDDPSLLNQGGNPLRPTLTNTVIGGTAGALPFDTTRNVVGFYGELVAPVAKGLELTSSVRHDHYDAAQNARGFDVVNDAKGNPVAQVEHAGSKSEGKSFDSTTYKVSGRYQPTSNLLLRGSYGTGFRAPSLANITTPLTFAGSTNGTYSCPFPGTVGCLGPGAQYDLLNVGNPKSDGDALKPEKSTQWTVGFRLEPSKQLSLGLDLWNVTIKDQIQAINENAAFASANALGAASPYAKYFSVIIDPTGGFPSWALSQKPLNLSKAEYSGVDWDNTFRTTLMGTKVSAQWTGTYMLKARYTDGATGEWQTSLGKYGPDNQVVFRVISNLMISQQVGNWANTLALHYKSGYHDQAFAADDAIIRTVKADGGFGSPIAFAGLDVSSYTTVDWQTKYTVNKGLSVSGGIKNLLDRTPPLTLQNAGAGNSAGYDGRYADIAGRTFYATASYKFW